MVNEGRGADTGSLIGRFLEGPEPIAGVVNVLFATVMLMFPLMLAIKLSPYYLLIFLVIASFWGGYFYSVRRWLCNEYRRALIARAVCLIAAFASVQGLFEPDYGSALRHLTPLIPMFFIILAGEQGGENNRKIGRRVVNESMFPVNGSSLYYPQQMPHNSHISPPSNSSGIQYPPPLSSSP